MNLNSFLLLNKKNISYKKDIQKYIPLFSYYFDYFLKIIINNNGNITFYKQYYDSNITYLHCETCYCNKFIKCEYHSEINKINDNIPQEIRSDYFIKLNTDFISIFEKFLYIKFQTHILVNNNKDFVKFTIIV